MTPYYFDINIYGIINKELNFERNRIRERTKEGIERVKAQGKKLGRPKAMKNKLVISL